MARKKTTGITKKGKHFKSAEDYRKYEAYKHIHICKSKKKKK